MARVELTPESIAEELGAFRAGLARGLTTLRRAREARLGATPRDAVMHLERMVLYRYAAPVRAHGTPLLIVYALVNRPDMIDLQRGRSLVSALLERGFDVYLIDWGYPTGADHWLGLADYADRYIDACVDFLRARLGREWLPLLGICQGGTFGTIYAALHPDKVERLITTVTPIDFHTPADMLSHLVRHIDVDRLVESCGNVSGDFLNALFLGLKPFRLLQQKYVHFLARLDDVEAVSTFLRMEQWIFDSPALPGTVCREFARAFYQHNQLVRGGLSVGGRTVDPKRITMPVLNVYARDDHLVPPDASRAMRDIVGSSDYTEAAVAGGHIGIYVSLRSPRSLPALVGEWMG